MKVLQTNFHRLWGGEANSALILAQGLRRLGHEVMLAVPADGELFRRAARCGVPAFGGVSYRSGIGWHNRADWKALRRLLREERFDVVHSHGSMDGWVAALAARGLPQRPVVVRTRHNLKRIRNHLLNRWYFRSLVDHVIAISRAVHHTVTRDGLVPPERVSVIHSATDLEPFLAGGDGLAFRRGLSLADDALVVTSASRLVPEKAVDLLVRAFAEVAARYPRARLVICGSGSRGRRQLKALAQELGVIERVVFAGFRNDMPAVFAATDVFALPSKAEPLGFVVIEAMASGVPVVATRAGGVLDIITDGEDGLLVDTGDPAAMAEGLRRLLGDADLRARLAAAGRQTVTTRFATARLVAEVEALYRRLLDDRKTSREHDA